MPARVVGAASGVRWLVEGWNIFRAAPLPWMALVFVYLFVMTLSWQVPYAGAALAVLFTPAISVSFMAVARAARSSRAVMTMTRVLGEMAQSRARTSSPVISFIQMSVTTTATSWVSTCFKKSAAFPKVLTAKPSAASR